MVTVVKRPQVQTLRGDFISASISSGALPAFYNNRTDFSNLVITCDNSVLGLSDLDEESKYIYIKSDIDEYNGFWYADIISTAGPNVSFSISEYKNEKAYDTVLGFFNNYVPYLNTVIGPGTVLQVAINTLEPSGAWGLSSIPRVHRWNAVHLPIVYKLRSTKWPNNTEDTIRNISTITNDNGFVRITVGSSFGSFDVNDYIRIWTIIPTNEVVAEYKIINKYSATDFTLNVSYSIDTSDWQAVQLYFINYFVSVNVVAGIGSEYTTFEKYKPEDTITTLNLVPDSKGIIFLNISDIIKEKISVRKNKVDGFTSPLDLDSFCQFHIEYSETYDIAGVSTTGVFVRDKFDNYDPSDNFMGYAVNSKLDFKNLYSGFMNRYLLGNTDSITVNPDSNTTGKFLTNFSRPTLFVGHYFDISYICDFKNIEHRVIREVYSNGVLLATFTDKRATPIEGVYRFKVEQSGYGEDRIDITIVAGTVDAIISETLTIDVEDSCTTQDYYLTWKNNLGGHDYWNFTADKTYSTDILKSVTQERNTFSNWPKSYGAFANTINQQTERRSVQKIKVNSQYVDSTKIDGLRKIVESILVQEFTDVNNLRTVIIDAGTLRYSTDGEDNLMIDFDITYTNENSTQSL